ncbi:MAG TPA: TonB-dependent receptor [Methylocystis sp.]|nr:TonB-dependent receptor [Methylocystis sp.]
MHKNCFARAVSAMSLSLALGAPAALAAQYTLPTIEVGAAKSTRPANAGVRAKPSRVAAKPAPRPAPTPAPRRETAPSQPTVSEANKPLSQPQKADTASSVRSFTQEQVTERLYSQPQEALEIDPGLVIAQHSGSGKAAQYFLRGFALDHGYDIGITFDGMNVNQPSHIHSNGYADVNFLIPELLGEFEVRKGPYFADEGVFSAVGAIHLNYVDTLRDGLFVASGGSFGWGRLVGAKSWGVGTGELLTALELNTYNGPWERPDEERKINGFARWSTGTKENGFSVTAMAYANHYFATDQIPWNDVSEGLMSRWGTEDPTDGGNASRYSLSLRWSETNKNDWSRVEAFVIHNDTNLYDDFTYNLVNPVNAFAFGLNGFGDQTHQFDHRTQLGLNLLHGWKYSVDSIPVETRVGWQNLIDFIHNGNGESFQRMQYDEISNNAIKEYIHGAYTDTTEYWTKWFRTTEGFRLDYVHGSVNWEQNPFLALGVMTAPPAPFPIGPYNNGELGRFFTSPKFGAVLGPFNNSEIFLNFGEGLRAEDIRGATNHFAVNNPYIPGYNYISNVQLLTKTRGAELGFRTKAIEGLDTSLSLFWQDLDAEQTFNADLAMSSYGRPGRRYGFEWTGRYEVNSWLHLDADVTGSHARFRGFDTIQAAVLASYLAGGPGSDGGLWPLGLPGMYPGNYLLLAPVWVSTWDIEAGEKTGWFGALQGRYFGPRPLTEDGQIESHGTFTVGARLGYRFDNGWKIQADAFNILNSRADMIDYQANVWGKQDFAIWPGYGATGAISSFGISERVYKPIDPPAVRLTLQGPLKFDNATPITSAVTADLPARKGPPLYAPPILWTGFYGGLTLGAGWASNSTNNVYLPYGDPAFALFTPVTTPFGVVPNGLLFLPGQNSYNSDNGGVVGGGQVGYNYQFGHQFGPSIVIGAEADIQGTSISKTKNYNNAPIWPILVTNAGAPGSGFVVPPTTAYGGDVGVPWFGTVRGRAGWLATPTLLIYGTGGFAYGAVNAGGSTTTATGWTVGGGAEWMFLPNWSAKVEYLYVRPSSDHDNNQGWLAGVSNLNPELNVYRAGVNYHFNWAAPAPVVASY